LQDKKEMERRACNLKYSCSPQKNGAITVDTNCYNILRVDQEFFTYNIRQSTQQQSQTSITLTNIARVADKFATIIRQIK